MNFLLIGVYIFFIQKLFKGLYFIFDMEHNGVYLYKGLPIIARIGIHEATMKFINDKFKKNTKILVVGCGGGAFEKRLLENGFKDINSSDIIIENYELDDPNVDFIQTDLNNDFSNSFKDKFDLIVAIEVIEHLYSTFNFLSESRKLLNGKGKIIFSTPNLHANSSILVNSLLFYPNYFVGKPGIYGHVNPILYGVLEYLCDVTKIKIIKTFSLKGVGEKLSIVRLFKLFIKKIMMFPIIIYSFFKNRKNELKNLKHEIAIYVLQKN